MEYALPFPATTSGGFLEFSLPDLPKEITTVVKVTPSPNQLPVVNAGDNQTIKLPKNSVTLSGIASDPDGVIVSWLWEILSGSGKLSSFDKQTTTLDALTEGTTIARLTVTDDRGATRFDDVAIIVQAADVVTPPTTYGTLIYSNGFDKVSDLDPFNNQQWGKGTLADHLSTNIFKTGPGSFKSVPANVSSGIRSEVQLPSSLTPTEGAIEYDVMYEKIFQNNGHSLQFHPFTNNGSASPGLWHENGKFLFVNWVAGTNKKYQTNYVIPQNRWMHVVLEYKFGRLGYAKLTIDGIVILDEVGIQIGDGSGQYLKVGVNMWQNQESVVYYDNLKIWKK